MMKSFIALIGVLVMGFVIFAGVALAQTASPSPTPTASPTASPTVPSGAPSTGRAR